MNLNEKIQHMTDMAAKDKRWENWLVLEIHDLVADEIKKAREDQIMKDFEYISIETPMSENFTMALRDEMLAELRKELEL